MSSRVGRVSQSHSFILRSPRLPTIPFSSIRRFVLYGAQRVRRTQMRAWTARSAQANAMHARQTHRRGVRSISAHFRHPHARRGIHLSEECEARVRDISSTASAFIPLLRPCSVPPRTSHVDADLDADFRYRCDWRFATIQLQRTMHLAGISHAYGERTYARGALSDFKCVGLTGTSFSVTTVIFLSFARFHDPSGQEKFVV